MKVVITPRAIYLPGPTFMEIGTISLPAPTPVSPAPVEEVCEDCGADLVPLIGDKPGEVRAMFCEACEFGV
ncbi:hypothetical protein [Streptomyces sp. NBC_00425]|uniref:hypothetical protein n=1 Tax=Streptomyces sp. NBC_00425 TaxID=2975740 RepID=UPI002E239380